MKDYATKIRQDFLRNIHQSPAQATVEQKIAQLGKAWILHPEYRRDEHPAHSNPGSEYLKGVRANAIRAGRI